MRKDSVLLLIVGALTLAVGASAQFQPESAHTQLYFPHFADGGPRAGQWQTTFTFVNAGVSDAEVSLRLYNDSGGPLSLDFGAGASSTHTFTVPAGGIRIRRSRIASETLVQGWAIANSSAPLQATVAFRAINDGTPRQEITAQPTLPTLDYISAANRFLGVAIANQFADAPISVDLGILDSEGRLAGGPVRVTVPPFGHTAFNVGQKFPGLGDFNGVLAISSVNRPLDKFVAWTLNADPSGTLSALPPGAYGWPISHWDRIWMVYKEVVNAARQMGAITWPVQLHILRDKEVNAYASGGQDIAVTVALSELISDSPSELAWAIAHELGHIYQNQTGRLDFDPNEEFDADIWGTVLALAAGYDPYAAAGTLAKLAMATGAAGLTTQFERQNAADAHKSFNTRIGTIYSALVKACNSPDIYEFCQLYKGVVHPSLPDSAPLSRERGRARE